VSNTVQRRRHGCSCRDPRRAWLSGAGTLGSGVGFHWDVELMADLARYRTFHGLPPTPSALRHSTHFW